jgi:ABC-2 type transport system permease protein
MKVLKFLLQKEFRQIFRNSAILRMIFILPIMQLIIMPLASDYEIKNINVCIVDNDHSSISQLFISRIQASKYFKIIDYSVSYNQTFEFLENDKADIIINIPPKFEHNLYRENSEKIFMATNAINGLKALVGSSYITRIIMELNLDLRNKIITSNANNTIPIIKIADIQWYNIHMNYKFFMVPGILVVLVTMVGVYMCALNIVKEKEVGTIEQINVTPISKFYFILGKLIPFWIIGNFVFSIGFFVVARLVYGIVSVGSIPLIYGFLSIYLIAVLGIGLLISTYSTTQQQAMSLAFFVMMIFMMMSGLFTSIDGMPNWAKTIAHLSPVSHFIEVMRMIVMKGSNFYDILPAFLKMIGFAFFFNIWAIWNYRKIS